MNTISRSMIAAFTLVGILLLTLCVLAEEQVRTEKVIKIASGDGDPVTLRFEGDTGFSDLADGESRTVTTSDGEALSVTRHGDKLTIITSAGQSVDLPLLHGAHASVETDGMNAGQHEQRRIRIMHKAGDDAEQILIVSPGGLSDQVQATIRQAIESAGINKEILFLGGGIDANIDVDIEIDN